MLHLKLKYDNPALGIYNIQGAAATIWNGPALFPPRQAQKMNAQGSDLVTHLCTILLQIFQIKSR